MSQDASLPLPPHRPQHVRSYPRFLWWALSESTNGSVAFYLWMFALTAVFLVGANAWAVQVADGMIVTNMTDHVSWGALHCQLYIYGGSSSGRCDDGYSSLSLSR
ncbi:MAG: hypothetical protein ACKVH8_01800 [Pirellulales bacterium]